MKINSIKVENYRSHESKTVNFTKGINLLLGQNGAGKSSLLEAFGYAMFYGSRSKELLRDGNLVSDIISFGKKNCTITIDFTGNDGIDYILERKFGTKKSSSLLIKGESESRLNDEQINSKLREICGMPRNTESIYKNVVTAYQNQIVGIFAEKNDSLFNSIFDTQIYEKISESNKGFASKAVKKYDDELNRMDQKVLDLSTQIVDSESLLKERIGKNDSLRTVLNQIENINQEIAEINSEITSLNKLRSDIKSLESEISSKQSLFDAKNEEFATTKNELESSKLSEDIVENNKAGFEKYKSLENIAKVKESAIIEKEKFKTKTEKIEKEISAYEIQLVELSTRKDSLRLEIQRLSDELGISQTALSNYENELTQLSAVADSLQTKSDNFSIINKQLIEFEQSYQAIKQDIIQMETIIKSKTDSLLDDTEIESRILALKDTLSILIEKEKKAQVLADERKSIELRIADTNEARQQLAGAICPILSETCQNITSGYSADNYFSSRLDEFQRQLNIVINNSKEYESIEKEIKNTNEQLTLAEKDKKSNAKLNNEIQQKNQDKTIREKELENHFLTVKLFSKDNANAFENAEELVQMKNQLDSKRRELDNQITANKTNFDSLKKAINEQKKDLTNKQTGLKQAEDKSNSTNTEIEKMSHLKMQKTDDLISLKEKTSDLPDLKIEILNIRQELELIKPSYDLYNRNIQSAEKKNSLELRISKLTEEIDLISTTINKLSLEKEHLSKSLDLSRLDSLTEKLEDKKVVLGNHTEEKTELLISISHLNKNIERNIALLKEMELTESKISTLNQKLELSKKLRDYIKQLGKQVAGRLMEKIELEATDNYRKISGKPERIKWSDYQVYLESNQDPSKRKKFNVLSGGEQVTVALSLRSAMASLMTDANFAIFDEPTVNLDTDRRMALSESLHSILKNLEQAIIVTHDNSFREMADNIVEL